MFTKSRLGNPKMEKALKKIALDPRKDFLRFLKALPFYWEEFKHGN